MLVLHVLQGPDAGKRFALPIDEPQLIGRSTEAIAITDKSVSRRHAELTPDGGAWFLRDLESSNGTFVNGRPVLERVELAAGDRIRCGDTLFVLAEDAALPHDALPAHAVSTPAAAAVEARLPANAPAVADPRFRLLQDLASLTDDANDRPRLLARALELVREEFGADRAAFVLPVAGAANVQAIDSTPGVAPPPIPFTAVEEATRDAIGLLTVVTSADAPEPSSALCVAVRTPERTLGALWVDRAMTRGAFDERHLRLLQAVGVHLGLLLRHGELVGAAIARERLAAMGETVATLSHSIKNILQALRGGADAVELALSRGDVAMANEGWTILARNLDRIHSLTRNMLAYAKERSLDLVSCAPNELVREIALLMTPAAHRKKARLDLDLDEGLPAIRMDPDAIHQAVINLVANAIECVPERSGHVVLATRWVVESGQCEISVRDNGPGIAETLKPKLFEPFASTKGQRGTGLGLAVSKKLVEQHGGTIDVTSTGTEGTTIAIRLPDRGPPDDADGTRGPQPIREADLGIEFGAPE
ncbi:MAG: FHA domain-containing protein [Phycisphaerae bacterium]|nr:FHA domain-containing protein [Phycisphaerae bacterium]